MKAPPQVLLQALEATSLDAPDARARPVLASCFEDRLGAWALVARPVPAGSNPRSYSDSPLVRLEVTRAEAGRLLPGAVFSEIADGCLAVSSLEDSVEGVEVEVADTDGDGRNEVLVAQRSVDKPDVALVYAVREGRAVVHPEARELLVTTLADVNGDGLADVSYRYVYDGGYDVGTGAPAPTAYSATLVGLGAKGGKVRFDGTEARKMAHAACPRPPGKGIDDPFCARLWGATPTSLRELDARVADCRRDSKAAHEAEAEAEKRRDEAGLPSEGAALNDARDGCAYLAVWQSLAQSRFPLTLLGTRDEQVVDQGGASRTEAAELAGSARKSVDAKRYDEALEAYARSFSVLPDVRVAVERASALVAAGKPREAEALLAPEVDAIADTALRAAALYVLGLALQANGKPEDAARAFGRAHALQPTARTASKLDGGAVCPARVELAKGATTTADQWANEITDPEAAQSEHVPARLVNHHEDVEGRAGHALVPPRSVRDAVRYMSSAWAVAYHRGASGAVTLCDPFTGCRCTAASPCVLGASGPGPAVRERAFFSSKGMLLARVRWPEDAVPDGALTVVREGAELVVRGLGCDQHLALE